MLLALSALAPTHAQKLYKWVDDKGVVHYSERLPAETTGKASEQLDRQGTVIKRQPAAPTAAELAERDAQRERERAAQQADTERQRRNNALLSSYASVRDIDDARERALTQAHDAAAGAHHNVAQLEAQREKLMQEAGTDQADKKPSRRLQRELDANAIDLRNARSVLEAKQHEIDAINQRYDEDRRMYMELTGIAPAGRSDSR